MNMRDFWTNLIQDAVDSIPGYRTRIRELEKELVTANSKLDAADSRIRGLTNCIHMKDETLKQIMPDWIPTEVEYEI